MQGQLFKENHFLQMNKSALRMFLFEVCVNKKSCLGLAKTGLSYLKISYY